MLLKHVDIDLLNVLGFNTSTFGGTEQSLRDTEVVQPALFCVEYSLARLLEDWNIRPDAMIGHSLGEYVAACLAGVLTLDDALMIVAARGRMMQETQPGGMLIVNSPSEHIVSMLGQHLSLAAENGPDLCVVSGSPVGLSRLQQQLEEQSVKATLMQANKGFHSQLMDPVVQPFGLLVSQSVTSLPRIPYVSNLTGEWISEGDLDDPEYWGRHLRGIGPVQQGLSDVAESSPPGTGSGSWTR